MFNQPQTNDLEQNESTEDSVTTPSENDTQDKENNDTDEIKKISPQPDPKIENPNTSALFANDESTIDDEIEEVFVNLEDLVEDDEYTLEERAEMEKQYGETMRVFRRSELVSGKIVNITATDVAVDIGFKSEGSIPHDEFDDIEKLKIGDDIEVVIDRIENREGSLVLSKRKAEFYRIWEKINDLYKSGEMLEAQISRRIKGGMIVDLFGLEAFLPGSQIDVHPVRDFDALVGVNMDFRIIKVNNVRKNVVLSHKVLVEESLREIRQKVLAELEEGQIVEGVVKNITDFGVFVDLGGVDGLLHITDLSWGRVSHPSDVVSLDEKIQVKVLNYDKEKQRISLGLKQLKEHHWDEIEQKYPLKSKVKGKVVSIVKYGAFIELEEGVEGLVHISEMSWTRHIKHPSQNVNVGDEIDIIVLNVDRENRKISLGIKQIDEDPWERLEQEFLSGTRHKGVVRDLVPFGAFVELEPGIDGLIHISDLSWTRKVRHPGEIVKKAQEIEVVILKFDKSERRIALGFKQLDEDPWDEFEKLYPIRSKCEGSVIRVLEKGVVMMLPAGVEGFIPNSQLGKELGGDNKRKIKEGDNIELQIIEFDKVNHRIVLSHSAIERGKERRSYRAAREATPEPANTIGALVGHIEKDDKPAKAQVKKAKDSAAKSDDASIKVTDDEKTVEVDKKKSKPEKAEDSGSDAVVTESKVVTPKDAAPKDVTPKDAAPKDVTPKDAAPKDVTPKDAAPKDVTPKDAAPVDKKEDAKLKENEITTEKKATKTKTTKAKSKKEPVKKKAAKKEKSDPVIKEVTKAEKETVTDKKSVAVKKSKTPAKKKVKADTVDSEKPKAAKKKTTKAAKTGSEKPKTAAKATKKSSKASADQAATKAEKKEA